MCKRVLMSVSLISLFLLVLSGCSNKTLTASHGKGGGDVQLLETVTDDQGNVQRFEYDGQNRIVKIDDITITYGDNLITAGDRKFVINGNTVTEENGEYTATCTIDKYGYIVSGGSGGEYKYENFNLISARSEYDNTVYSYDRMKSPLCNSDTPKWLIRLLLYKYDSYNNVVSVQGSYEGEGEISTSYKYEYDSEGFPVAAVEKEKHSAIDGITTRTIRYTYRGKSRDAAVEAERHAAAAAKAAKKKRSVSKKEAAKREAAERAAAEQAAAAAYADMQYQNALAEEAKAEEAKAKARAEADAAEEAKAKARAEADAAAAAAYLAAQQEAEDAAKFTDTRDGRKYKTVVIGGKTWMAENLNYEKGKSWCYNKNNSNCDKYGRLYDWKTAKTVCPSGYHLPSRQEWDNLAAAAGGKDAAGKKLKARSGWNGNGNGTDEFGFSALPGGDRDSDGSFINAGDYGNWWTATEYDGSDAYRRYMNDDRDNVGEDNSNKSNGFSVRCVYSAD
jgi:uncharacterized protein (TIGR02145 family)